MRYEVDMTVDDGKARSAYEENFSAEVRVDLEPRADPVRVIYIWISQANLRSYLSSWLCLTYN